MLRAHSKAQAIDAGRGSAYKEVAETMIASPVFLVAATPVREMRSGWFVDRT
jgi:hypothetical protein